MRIGLIGDVSLRDALQAAGHTLIDINVTSTGDLAGRVRAGTQAFEQLRGAGLGAVFDCDGAGLLLVQQPGNQSNVNLLHESLGLPLVSEFRQPAPQALAALTPEIFWQCLSSQRWHKLVADRPQAEELRRFGVPGVIHLASAAPLHVRSSGADAVQPCVRYAGDANTRAFGAGRAHLGSTLRQALMNMSGSASASHASFLERYSASTGFTNNAAIEAAPPVAQRSEYFAARQLFTSIQQLLQRDQAIHALKRELGDKLELCGEGWTPAHGLISSSREHAGEAAALVNVVFVATDAEFALEPNCFAIACGGGMLLCQRTPELQQYFAIGEECDVFEAETELIRKCRFYLENPAAAHRIAAAGRERVIREHLTTHRLMSLADEPALQAIAPECAAAPSSPPRMALAATAY